MTSPPPWLVEYQAGFTRMLRTPLTLRAGELAPTPARFAEPLCAATLPGPTLSGRERLTIYNRQYWLRLLTTVQGAYPLTVGLLGAHAFNLVALQFLVAHPPRAYDLDGVADGFCAFLVGPGSRAKARARSPLPDGLPIRALEQAARLDHAFRAVFHAGRQARLDPDQLSPRALPDVRLSPSPAVQVVHEDWALLPLRRRLARARPVSRPVPLPPAHPSTQAWAVRQTEGGVVLLPLARAQARLYELLASFTVGQALAALEAEQAGDAVADLPHQVEAWMAFALEHGFWTDAQVDPP